MPKLIDKTTLIEAYGEPPKSIEEFVGEVNTGDETISIARMKSPSGWSEPGQRPHFREISIVLKGSLHVEYEDGSLDVEAGQSVITEKDEWIRYSTPGPDGAEYIAVCMPAFSPESVNRDE